MIVRPGVPIVTVLLDVAEGLVPRLPRRPGPAVAVLAALALNLGPGLALGLPPARPVVLGRLAAHAAMGSTS